MERIGFIGTGIMGKPMVLNLAKAGYTVLFFNRSPADELVRHGLKSAASAKAVAAESDVIITMLPDSPEVETVLLGRNGVLEGIREGALFIDMSTIAPEISKRMHRILADRGVAALDAPVSGGEVGAREATLSIMVGGEAAAFERALPVFRVLGKNIVHIGPAGAGQVAKACNQIVVALTIQAVSEAMVLARKSGVDLGKVREALLGGFAQSRILDLHGKRIIENNFKPGFRVRLHRKDMNIILETARALAVPLPGSALVASQMEALLAQGNGDLDHSALALLLGQLAGLK